VPGTGERAAGVQINEKGVVKEAKTEILGEKERGECKECQLTPASNQAAVAIAFDNLVQRIRVHSPVEKPG